MFFVGMGMMVQMASANTYLQHLISDDKRARVMSIYTMAFMGATPIGSFLVGVLASAIGVHLDHRLRRRAFAGRDLVFAGKFLPLGGWKRLGRLARKPELR